jgi:hypothetical protein
VPVTESVLGRTTISWSAPEAQVIEIHIGSPDGQLFTINGNRGSIQTGLWVSDGLTFYLQDVTGGKPLTSDYTLATLVLHLQAGNTNGAAPQFEGWAAGAAALLLCVWLLLARRMPRRRIEAGLAGAILMIPILLLLLPTKAQTQPSAQRNAATLDRMLAANKSQQELARSVFDTYGCNGCHAIGQEGKLGFTSRGKAGWAEFRRVYPDAHRDEHNRQRSGKPAIVAAAPESHPFRGLRLHVLSQRRRRQDGSDGSGREADERASGVCRRRENSRRRAAKAALAKSGPVNVFSACITALPNPFCLSLSANYQMSP